MSAQTDTVRSWIEAYAQELRRTPAMVFAILIALVGLGGSWLSLPGHAFRWGPFAVFFALFAAGVVALALDKATRLARFIPLAGASLSLFLAMRIYNAPYLGYFGSLIIIASAGTSPLAALLGAALNTVVLLLAPASPDALWPSIALLWLTAAFASISAQALYTALNWAWQSQQRSDRLLSQLRVRHGELNRTLAALTETTRRLQRVSQELAVARARAEEARQMKEQFAANISHELRTPLNLILGFSEMIYFRPDVYGEMNWPVPLRRDVHQIYRSSQQLLELVNDVLDLSRMDAARLPVRKERADLLTVVNEAIDTVADLLRGRPVALRREMPESLPPLAIDRTRIRQVLLNLLNNATRFTERGSITVRMEPGEHDVVVSVIDTGVGISEDDLARIFDEFHQVDMSFKRWHQGAGLGLAISKRFVQLHGGRIWATSEPGAGSVFSFSLPLDEAAEPAPQLLQRPAAPAAVREPVLLAVDSDPEVGTVLSRYLDRYYVVQAPDLNEARTMVEQWHPTALLLNIPPQTDHGAAALSALTEQGLGVLPPRVPLVLCSLPSQEWLAAEAQVRGALSKPVTREQVLYAIQSVEGVRDVLVVDDDRGFVQMIARFLETAEEPYSVRWAYDGAEALDRIRERRPDLVLLDLVMPVMDGFATLQALRDSPATRDVPVLLVTVTSYLEDMLAQHGSGLSVVRREGFSPSEVVHYLAALLDATEAEYPVDAALARPGADLATPAC